jgi:hypothetical protein
MAEEIAKGSTIKIKPTSHTTFHGIANMQGKVHGKIGKILTIEIANHMYLAEEKDVELVEKES